MRTNQAPIHSGFGPQTTASDVLGQRRLDGRIAIVSGGYAGVGLETTRALASAGASVIVPARSLEKARAALAATDGVELESLDLFDPESIDSFATRFLATGRPLATNHIGHYQLTARLWPALLDAGAARVVSVSSRGHAVSAVDFEDPHFGRRPYDRWIAYGQSKTANALSAIALDARGEQHGIQAFSVHPGAVGGTDLMRSIPEEERRAVASASNAIEFLKTLEQGAATSVWCATSAQLDGKGGVYCEDVDVAAQVPADSAEPRGVRPWARDPDLAERLWAKSEEWTGAKLTA